MNHTMEKVERKSTLGMTKGIVLGRHGSRDEILALPEDFVGNIMVIGSCGTGKTMCNAIPYVLQAIKRGESVIIYDPKNMIYQETHGVAINNGYKIEVIDERDVRKKNIDYLLPCKERALCYIKHDLSKREEEPDENLKNYWQKIKEFIVSEEKENDSPQKFNFVLEEFHMTGDTGRDILLTCKKYNIGTMCLMQTSEQLTIAYPDDWERIVNNCNIIISTQVTTMKQADFLIELFIGKEKGERLPFVPERIVTMSEKCQLVINGNEMIIVGKVYMQEYAGEHEETLIITDPKGEL